MINIAGIMASQTSMRQSIINNNIARKEKDKEKEKQQILIKM